MQESSPHHNLSRPAAPEEAVESLNDLRADAAELQKWQTVCDQARVDQNAAIKAGESEERIAALSSSIAEAEERISKLEELLGMDGEIFRAESSDAEGGSDALQ